MDPGTHSPFVAWESFYVIVGSSAAALTGLQFVVIALVAEVKTAQSMREVNAFGTPTVVHFCAVLLGSALLSAPWHRLSSAGLTLAVFGLGGIVYTLIVVRRARQSQGYKPVLEDWIWHVVFPMTAYLVATGAGFALPRYPEPLLFAIGGSALLLLYVGIHNSWDTVTYIAVGNREPSEGPSTEPGPGLDRKGPSRTAGKRSKA
jgi:hypothetical protein